MIQRPTGADMPVYASLSTMRQQPTQDEIANGVIPLDTLPANWWNWLWNTITRAQNDLQYNDEVIFTEINNVLAAGGITPNPTADAQATHDQLIRAINIIKNAVATTTTLGVVKSSDTGTDGTVRVNTGGTMNVNGFGDLATLHTVDKDTVTGAINEVHDEMDALNTNLTQEIQNEASEIRGEIGTLSSLTTTAKNNLVAAVNELKTGLNTTTSTVNTNKTAIGTLSSLTTTAKTNLVSAINELKTGLNTATSTANTATSTANTNKTAIGTLSSLTTTAKDNLVAAVNELQTEVNTKLARYTTTMLDGGFVSSAGGYISLRDFWNKLVERYGLSAEVHFYWYVDQTGFVSIDGTANTAGVRLDGSTVIYDCRGRPNEPWTTFHALVLTRDSTPYIMFADVAESTTTLLTNKIYQLASASDVSAAGNTCRYTYVVDSDAALTAWANNDRSGGRDYTSVLIRKGTWTSSKGVNLTTAGTKVVVGEAGSRLVFNNVEKGLYYDTAPTEPDYYMRDVTVTITGNGNGFGFSSCTNLTNCTGSGNGTGFGTGFGFSSCTNLTNCTGTGTGTGNGNGYGFNACTNLTNCTGTGTGTGTGAGFYSCTNLTNCTGNGNGYGTGIGFYSCTNLTNCTGTGTGTGSSNGMGVGFRLCNTVIGCKAGRHCTTAVFQDCYASSSKTSTYACADTANGGFNNTTNP